MRPLKYRKTAGGATNDKAGRTGKTGGGAAHDKAGARSASGGSARGNYGTSGSSARGGSKVQEEDPTFRRRKKSPVKAVIFAKRLCNLGIHIIEVDLGFV